MAFTVTTSFQTQGSILGLSTAEINESVRRGGEVVGVEWVVTMLPTHFGSNAAGMYSHAPRTPGWKRRKLRAKQRGGLIFLGLRPNYIPPNAFTINTPRGKQFAQWVVRAPQDIMDDNVFTGWMRSKVLNKTASAFNIRSKATRGQGRVTVPVPLGHPRNPKNVGELTGVTGKQAARLRRTWQQVFHEQIRALALAKGARAAV